MHTATEDLVERAGNGDAEALESLIERIRDRIYGLAMRMLWHPQDAEDASQEILLKIVTHLGSFRRECAFTTWCYRIAVNHLLTTRKRRAELFDMTFAKVEEAIDKGIEYARSHATPDGEQDLLAKEVMIGCIQGVMLCLDREHRLAYILGEVYEVSGNEGAEALGITPEAFRKRLSRARNTLRDFLVKNCGLVGDESSCSCKTQIPYSMHCGIVSPRRLLFAEHPCRPEDQSLRPEAGGDPDASQRVAELMRRPEYAAPHGFVQRVTNMIKAGGIPLPVSRQ